MNNIQQKIHTALVATLIIGAYGVLDASQSATQTVVLQLADKEEYTVARKDLKELTDLSTSGYQLDPLADKVSLQNVTKVGIEALMTNLAVIKRGGKDLQKLFRDFFADKQQAEIVECRKKLELGDHLGIALLQSAECLGIESVQIAVKEYLRLIASLKNHRTHRKDLRPLYALADGNKVQKLDEECDPGCIICLDAHDEQDEEALACNHVFGKKCIKEWEAKSVNKDCPQCRAAISYKATGICALCADPIDMREPSCFYDCNYRACYGVVLSEWDTERHIFHERCIAPYARRAAFTNNEFFLDKKPGDIIFHCPVKHKKGSPNAKTDHKVLLSKVLPIIQFKDDWFPLKDKVQTACEICHRTIQGNQKKSSYKCRWLASEFHWGHTEKEHMFHEDCLKPLVERSAYKKEDGKMYFFCPAEHDGAVRLDQLDIPLLPGFTPDHIQHLCGVCRNKIGDKDQDVQMVEFNGYSRALSVDFIREQTWYHNKCLGEFLAKSAVKKVTWGGEVQYVYPCPFHQGTSRAHEFVLSHHVVTEAGK